MSDFDAAAVRTACREAERDSLGIEHDEEGPGHHPIWVPCGTWADLWVPETASHYGKCPCCPWERLDDLAEGTEVVAHGKPGIVRWVLPAGKGVCVVFGDSMLWFYGDEIGKIEERE